MTDTETDNGRYRAWVFTYNNYDSSGVAVLQEALHNSKYVVWGHEVCPTTGTPHLQGYFYLRDAKTFGQLKKIFPSKVRFEAAKGTPQQNRVYCTKTATDIYEQGTIPKQGKRNDLDEIREVIAETNSMAQVVMVAKSFQAVRMAEVVLKYHEKPRNWKPNVKWFWGDTGTGKTKEAMQLLGDNVYVSMTNSKWWEGYDSHENVLIDDFRKDFCKFEELLRILDRTPYRVEVKGSSRQFRAKNIIITSAYHPIYVYGRIEEDVHQLIRRIDEIREFA